VGTGYLANIGKIAEAVSGSIFTVVEKLVLRPQVSSQLKSPAGISIFLH